MADQRVPDFFVAGNAKSGTTALYEMLRRHPQIYLPAIKEMRFFAKDIKSRAELAGTASPTLEGHLALFEEAPAEACVGETSVLYLFSRVAATEIAALAPAGKIIAILREPASFLRSVHLQRLQDRSETEKDLRRAIALEPERRAGRQIPPGCALPPTLLYTDRARYLEQLRRYDAVFPREQMLVLIYEEFRRDNVASIVQMLRFLELDDTQPIHTIHANPTVAVRSERLEDATRSLRSPRTPLARAARRAGRALTSERMRASLFHPALRRATFAAPPPPDEQLMRELRERFAPEVRELSDYLGRDLVSLWGYQDAG